MTISSTTYNQALSIVFTKTTDSESDFSGISGNTFFRNFSNNLPYYKNSNGDVYHIFSGSSTADISTTGDVYATTFYGDGSQLSGISTDNFYTTAFTYNNNTFTLSRNGGLSTLTQTVNTMTGLTVNGTLSATTISATTFYGDGSRLTNVSLFKLVRHDFTSSGATPYSYCGTAVAGTSESSAAWQIKRIAVSLDGTTSVNTATNVAWTNRYNATYI